MLLVRDIMYCKPGKVRPLVEKFKKVNEIGTKLGFPYSKIMTDFSAERFWTVVVEFEVESLEAFEKMFSGSMEGQNPDLARQFEEAMKGYHDLVDHGRREIYKLEG